MKINVLAILFLSVFLWSCSSRDDDASSSNEIDCLNLGTQNLVLTIQESFTALPSKVSVFFKVNDVQGGPIAGLSASDFRILEMGQNDDCFNEISSLESSATISSNSQIFVNTTFLVLDLSNSVLAGSLTELKEASNSFINSVMPATSQESFQMGIYWFNGEDILHELQAPTSNAFVLQDAINSITEDISNDPSTDLYGAVIKATELAELTRANFEAQEIFSASAVVLFTDGTDQAARYTEEQALNSVTNANDNISFFTIGLGQEIDLAILNTLGSEGSVFTENSEELVTIFNEVSNNVAGQANSFYLFEYCSPKRDGSGVNELVIQAIQNEQTGIVTTSFDATGFTGGCQ